MRRRQIESLGLRGDRPYQAHKLNQLQLCHSSKLLFEIESLLFSPTSVLRDFVGGNS